MADTPEFVVACAVLGLSNSPTPSEARTAFRDRAALLHPDVHQSAGAHRTNAATVAMQQLNDAYRLVLELLDASESDPTGVRDEHHGVTHRCINCRSEFQHSADAGSVACPHCGHGLRVRSRNHRSYSANGPRAGRVVVSSSNRPPRTPRRSAPRGRLAHLRMWHDGS
jgi:DNA-directed RNA polymerase subunit RPC12/RpoP